jgi:hypothetical protein
MVNYKEPLTGFLLLLIKFNMYKSILIRFLKGAIAGAVASMSMVTIQQPSVWADFGTLFSSLGMAGLFGAITGLLLALQKWATWTE